MSPRRTLDVSHLPTTAFGSRDPLWWGVVGLMCIESTAFLLMLASHVYIRGNFDVWPPSAMPDLCKRLAAVNVGILLLSVVTMHWTGRASARSELRGMRWGLLLSMFLGLVFLAIRAYELRVLPFRWDDHAYGSSFWLLIGMHTLHTITGCLEDLVLAVVLFRGPVEEKHLVDVRVNGLYWYFVVASWLPTYALLFLDPAVLRS